MDERRYTFKQGHDEWDQPTGPILVCRNCTGIGVIDVEGRTLADVLVEAEQHERHIHRRR